MKSLNLGIGGDQTQHVLWRIENGELDGLPRPPKALVLLIGTNNWANTAEEVVEGILTCVSSARQRLPFTQILVVAVPPRAQYHEWVREKILHINSLVQQRLLAEPWRYPMVRQVCAELWNVFVNQYDNTISVADMPDFLHFSDIGYTKYFQPILDQLNQIVPPPYC